MMSNKLVFSVFDKKTSSYYPPYFVGPDEDILLKFFGLFSADNDPTRSVSEYSIFYLGNFCTFMCRLRVQDPVCIYTSEDLLSYEASYVHRVVGMYRKVRDNV